MHQEEHISSRELAMSAKPCASGLAHMTAVDIANAFAIWEYDAREWKDIGRESSATSPSSDSL
jgi:hypothetical protein